MTAKLGRLNLPGSWHSLTAMMRLAFLVPVVLLSACSQIPVPSNAPTQTELSDTLVRPNLRPAGLGRVVPEDASTAEQFDVTTQEERIEASEAPVGGRKTLLGTTIASLGDPTQAGFWIKTPLADTQGPGLIVFPGNGRSVQLELFPLSGSESAGSRVSLAALRLLGAPLTSLPEIEVYSVSGGS